MKKIIFLFFGIFLMLYGCGYKEGIVQKDVKSFLKFSGDYKNVSVQIDDGQQFIVGEKDQDNNKLYQILPGKHFIKVYRDNKLIVDRILNLDDQTTMEIIIP